MPKTIIAHGRTTSEAISNGLKELNVPKEKVNIKIIEEHEKRSFFSILAPRVVKVELTLKEEVNDSNCERTRKENLTKTSKEELDAGKERVEAFLKDFVKKFESLEYSITENMEKNFIKVDLNGDSSRILIGYRGEVLNAFQVILNSIANRESNERVRIILNISNYREKREKSLEELADKISKTVIKTGKSITLEPMMAYERKIIHNRLQTHPKVKTHSIGEEPRRRVVISKK